MSAQKVGGALAPVATPVPTPMYMYVIPVCHVKVIHVIPHSQLWVRV